MDSYSALLVSNDPGTLSITQRVLEEYGFHVNRMTTAAAAEQALRSVRFDLAIYDNDVPGALQLAGGNSTVAARMAFALMRRQTVKEAKGKQVHFIIQKPFTTDLITRSLRAAFGTMLRQKRRTFRHSVQIVPSSCTAGYDGIPKKLGNPTILNISQSGLCMKVDDLLAQGVKVQIELDLPESFQKVCLRGIVIWSQASGRTGVKLTDVKVEHQKLLNEWLNSRLPYPTELLPRVLMAAPARPFASMLSM
jgi:CheY-like chemotaxis protein